MPPTAIAALIALGGVIASAIASFAIAHMKLATENRLDIASYRAIRKLLRLPDWEMRSFEAIKRHFPGFEDDELRKLLVAAGAIAFYDVEKKELWGLLQRNKNKIQPGLGQRKFRYASVISTRPRPISEDQLPIA